MANFILCYNENMFTGMIEEIGEIRALNPNGSGLDVVIDCKKILSDVKVGDSISVNGCCQTVVEFGENYFKTNLSQETLGISTFSNLKVGYSVNLERAVTPNSRLGGHIVQGHVDGVAVLRKVISLGDFFDLYFEVPTNLSRYIAKKGSITVDGISLTVSDETSSTFRVSVIPHTFENTTLHFLKIGDKVNIETDIIARYTEKILGSGNESRIDENFLKENGFM